MTQKLSWLPLGESLSSVEYFWLKTYGESSTFEIWRTLSLMLVLTIILLLALPGCRFFIHECCTLHRDVMLWNKYQNKAKVAKHSAKLYTCLIIRFQTTCEQYEPVTIYCYFRTISNAIDVLSYNWNEMQVTAKKRSIADEAGAILQAKLKHLAPSQ